MKNRYPFAAVIALVFALSACNPGGGGSTDATEAELLEFGDAAADEFVQSGEELGLQESLSAGFGGPSAGSANLGLLALPAGCRTITAGATTDTDGDGIPDDLTVTFDATNCVKTGPFGGTLTKGGVIRFQDNSATPDRAHTVTQTGMGFTETRPNGIIVKVDRSGTRNVTQVGVSSLTRVSLMTGTYSHTNQALINWTNSLTWTYQAAGAGVIGNIGTALPQGGVTVNGPMSFTRNGTTRQFTVSTANALNYDPACANRVFVGGTVRLVGANATVKIDFNPCGANPPRTVTIIP